MCLHYNIIESTVTPAPPTPSPPTTGCTGPPLTGVCIGVVVAWTYNSATQNCVPFAWGVCPNLQTANNYASEDQCEAACEGQDI